MNNLICTSRKLYKKRKLYSAIVDMLVNKSKYLFVAIILILLCQAGCQTQNPFFYDFETEAALDTFNWKCKTLFTLSDKHVTSGQKSLKLELYPSPYPGIMLKSFHPDWSGNKTLRFDIYNHERIPLDLGIRIDDIKKPSYVNRYNNTVSLDPGANRISIPLNALVTSGTNRRLNLLSIEKIILFLVQPEEKRTLYLDNVHLE